MKSSFHGNPPPRILIVEDGLIMARDIERRLQSMGYGVVGLASSGEEAIKAVTRAKPDLVLMDVRLKGSIDGIQTAEKIHTLADVPIVYATAYSDDATLTRARQTEPFGFVLKPFEERELRTTIEMALYRHEMYRKMHVSEQRYRVIAELTTLYVYGLRVSPDGKVHFEWVSDGFARLTGVTPEALVSPDEYVQSQDAKTVKQRLQQWAAGKDTVTEYRLRLQSEDLRWVRDQARVVGNKDAKENIHIIGAVQDISLQKAAEVQAQEAERAQAECGREIAARMEEQAQHIVSLLECHSASVKTRPESWEGVVSHVRDVLDVHRSVYGEGSPGRCRVDHQVETLAAQIFKRLGPARVTYTVDAIPAEVESRLATGILLIVQELLTNSLRHSFPGSRKGHVHVVLSEEKGKHLVLQVVDDGVGLRKDVDIRKAKSAGFSLIRKLCGEIQASLEVERGSGLSVSVVIPT
ncbi:MAG: signal transduction histidine kinase [Bacteroidetes bacterium]|nr:signal transduction histidine kinase [Bacteroidota bacterium]